MQKSVHVGSDRAVDDNLLQLPYIQCKKVKYAILYQHYLFQKDGNCTKADNPLLWQYREFYQWWLKEAQPYITNTGLTGYGISALTIHWYAVPFTICHAYTTITGHTNLYDHNEGQHSN